MSKGVWHGPSATGLPLHLVQVHGRLVGVQHGGSRCSLFCSGLHVTCCICLHRVVVAWIGGDSWIGGHSCGLGGTHVDWWAHGIGGHSCGLGGTHVDWWAHGIGGHSCGLGGTHVDWWALMWIGGHSCGLGGTHVDWGALMWIGGHSCGLVGTHVDWWALVFVGSHVCIVRVCVCVCVHVCMHVPECQGEGEKCMWQ